MQQVERSIDFRAILDSALRLFAPWFASVVVVTMAGYPGVVCVTPMAWLIALAVGVRVIGRSSSSQASQRVLEAALAGMLLGVLESLLFLVVLPRLGPVQPDELVSAIGISLAIFCVGIPVPAGLSALTAWMVEHREGNL